MSPRFKWFLIILFSLWVLALFGGHFIHDEPHANDIALDTEVKIFRNFRMHIDRKIKDPDGSIRLVVRGDYLGQKTGLNLHLQPQKARIEFDSLGPESNQFLKMMNDYYLTRLPSRSMVPRLKVPCLPLKETSPDWDKGPVEMALYFPEKDKKETASLNISVDWPNDVFYFLENDVENRRAILLAFRGE